MSGPATLPASATGRRPDTWRLEASPAASWIAMVALAGFSARLRWERLGASALFLDDAWVAMSTRVSDTGDLFRIGSASPGFIFLIVRPWAWLFGSSVDSLQALPFVFGVIGPPLCFWVARVWHARFGPAVLAGVLLAISPEHRTYSTDLKQYPIEAVVTLLLLWECSLVVAEPASRRRWLVLMVSCVAASCFSMSQTVIVVGVLCGAGVAAFRRDRTRLPRLAIVSIQAYAVFAVAWYWFVLRPHLNSALYEFWDKKFVHLSHGLLTVPGQIVARLYELIAGFTAVNPWLAACVAAILGLALMIGRPAFAAILMVPTLLALVLDVAQVAPVGTGRTDIYLYPTLALFVAMGMDQLVRALGRPAGQRLQVGVLGIAGLALVATPPGLPPYIAENIRPLVQRLERERAVDEITLIYPLANFGYGLATELPFHIRASDRYPMSFFVEPDDDRTFVLPREQDAVHRYARIIADLTKGHDRVWLIGTHLKNDWGRIRQFLIAEGFRVERYSTAQGASLILYTRPSR